MFLFQELTEQISSGAAGHSADEELVREHALTLLRWWVFKCQDYIRSIDQEAELPENMERMRGAPGRPVARQPEQAPPTHRQPPVLIVREKMKVSAHALPVHLVVKFMYVDSQYLMGRNTMSHQPTTHRAMGSRKDLTRLSRLPS